MRQTRPLPDTHPEFTVLYWPGFTEYRVEHWQLARDGSGRVVPGTCVWSWVDAVVVVVVAMLAWSKVIRGEQLLPLPVPRSLLIVGIGIVLIYLVWARFTQVLHESLLVFPALGIQLETHRGHPLLPLCTTRHFIPLSALHDVVIHEGFRRWNVRYYLAALKRTRGVCVVHEASGDITTGAGAEGKWACACASGVEVRVAFENVLPYFPVLKVVYLGVQETLFPPPTRVVQTDG